MVESFNPSYIGPRQDVVSALEQSGIMPQRILDVGCATGEVGAHLRQSMSATVHGVEIVASMAHVAKQRLDTVFLGSAEEYLAQNDRCEEFDAIVLADVLEHMADPWATLAGFNRILRDDGVVVISLPNIRHWTTIFSLAILGDWPHRDRGIHDRTHLRFFTQKSATKMLNRAGLRIVSLRRNFRLLEGFSRVNRLSRFTNLPLIRPFFVFQYVFVCKKLYGFEGGGVSV